MRNRLSLALMGLLVIVAALSFQVGDVRAAATGLTASINLAVGGTYSSTVDLLTSQAKISFPAKTLSLTFGTGANQADRLFTDTRSTSSAEDLDIVAGSLTDAFGTTFTLAELKVLIVCASSANTTNVVLGGDANSVPFLSTAATTVAIKPGGCFFLTDPSAGGVAVTADTGDIIQVAPSSGTVAYDIIIMGSSS